MSGNTETTIKFEKPMDLNVRIIKAVECCPLLYKGHASIQERQVVWQQLSEQMNVPEFVLKSRWHVLCAYYQRCLEKRRSTDDNNEDGTNATTRNAFKYEKEMDFMMSYMHARITIAAANAARKQQELATAGNAEQLTDPEFVITEKDVEIAMNLCNNIKEEYMFYDVETLDGEVEVQNYTQDEEQEGCDDEFSGGGGSGGVDYNEEEIINGELDSEVVIDVDSNEQQLQIIEEIPEDMGEVIEEVDESENIVLENIIIDSNDLIAEESAEIIIEDEEEILQMDEQIEMQNETVIEEIVDDETIAEIEEVHSSTPLMKMPEQTNLEHDENMLRLPTDADGHKFAKILTAEINQLHIKQEQQQQHQQQQQEEQHYNNNQHNYHQQQQQQQHHHHHHYHHLQQQHQHQPIKQSTLQFPQEYALMTRRRRAVVLKATPRVQVELTDNAFAIIQHDETEGAELDVAANVAVVDGISSGIASGNIVKEEHQQHLPNLQQQKQRVTPEKNINATNIVNDNTPIGSDLVSTTADNDDGETNKNERSEDTIFGELVTAMLKHMPQDRKRAIKKKIMDLLLT